MSDQTVDVIIVGGRPAGASLAARLGAAGLSVVVLDKAEFPSPPEVPSSPIIYPPAIELLDEIGVDEGSYAASAVTIRRFFIIFDGYFRAEFAMIDVRGRDYAYGIDRAGFDAALWDKLGRFESVTARAGFKVEQLVRGDDGRVVGVIGRERDAEPEQLRARLCVVGADGRHSTLARRVGARKHDDSPHTSTIYQALWQGIPSQLPDGAAMLQLVTRGTGQNVIFFPSPAGHWVCVHTRSDRVDIRGDAEGFYREAIDAYPVVREQLTSARQISGVQGLKRIANCYVDHGGPGWLLVGDAVHKKDPVDGQGIYDALIESKRLAAILCRHAKGELEWAEVVADWGRALREETEAMFRSTVGRLEAELYDEPPELAKKTMVRWLLQDPDYQREFMRYLCREVSPRGWPPKSLLLGACGRGVVNDLRRLVGRSRA